MSGAPSGQIVVRTYKAKNQAAAGQMFAQDAQRMASQGYFPVSQSWAQGSWGCGAFLIALLLAIVVVGILIFIYLLVVKPDGTLTVTYEFRGLPAPPPVAATGAPPELPVAPDPIAALDSLTGMRDQGLISPEEFEAKKAELLRRM